MGQINVLDFSVANLIAAGEVVERPASVVKELLENSIDAGADMVTVEIKRGGVTFIRVADNGCGMTREDLPVALKRHATSKIKSSEDLDSIKTLGFRGEALAAIASVSNVRILSRTRDSDIGTALTAVSGEVTELAECGCAVGTTVIVEELFGTVPARRKFLKKDMTEAMAVCAVVEKIALSHSEIGFKLIIDGAVRFATSGDKILKNTIYAVLGRDFAVKLIEISGKNSGAAVSGYIGRPDNVRSNRNFENVFINGRYIRSKTISAALEQAYASYIPEDKFPASVIFLEVPPSTVDVNVHPAKLEVKFSNEKAVFEAVYYSVRSALESGITRPEMDMRRTGLQDMKAQQTLHAFAPIANPGHSESGRQVAIGTAGLFKEIMNYASGAKPASTVNEASEMPELSDLPAPEMPENYVSKNRREGNEVQNILPAASSTIADTGKTASKPTDEEKISLPASEVAVERIDYRIAGVLFDCYILAEHDGIVTVIDKHAAHERIIFESLKKNLKQAERATQLLMFPIEVRLSNEEYAALFESKDALSDTGFTLEFRPGCVVEVTEIPVSIEADAVTDMVVTMGERLSEGTGGLDGREAAYEKALYQASCKAAVKAGRHDEPETIKIICERVMNSPEIRFCPHGRPVSMDMKKSDFDRQFSRI